MKKSYSFEYPHTLRTSTTIIRFPTIECRSHDEAWSRIIILQLIGKCIGKLQNVYNFVTRCHVMDSTHTVANMIGELLWGDLRLEPRRNTTMRLHILYRKYHRTLWIVHAACIEGCYHPISLQMIMFIDPCCVHCTVSVSAGPYWGKYCSGVPYKIVPSII
jgi:hypothetical protein